MLNSTVEVRVIENDNKTEYNWRPNRNTEWQKLAFLSEKGIFRMLLREIYKDKIPLTNIHICRSIENKFEEYKSSHIFQIEALINNYPTNWVESHNFLEPSSVSYDSDGGDLI